MKRALNTLKIVSLGAGLILMFAIIFVGETGETGTLFFALVAASLITLLCSCVQVAWRARSLGLSRLEKLQHFLEMDGGVPFTQLAASLAAIHHGRVAAFCYMCLATALFLLISRLIRRILRRRPKS